MISCVSYNTNRQLVRVLEEQTRKHNIDFWAFVNHHPEEDERKCHTHLLVVPSKKIDTNEFKDLFDELDPQNPTKPFACLPFRKSTNFGDWYLYAIHDKRYLASKGQLRKYSYRKEDFFVSDIDYFTELIHQIDMSKLNKNYIITEALENGVSLETLAMTGQIPVQQFNQFRSLFEYLRQAGVGCATYRGIDENGCVIESHTSKDSGDLPF